MRPTSSGCSGTERSLWSLPTRDAQPMGVVQSVRGVVAQSAEFTGSHAGAGQELDDQPAQPVGVGGESGHELRRAGVVEELWCRLVCVGQVPGEDGYSAR